MRNSLLSLGLVAVSALVAGCGGGNPATPGAGEASVSCPSVDEAKQAIETLVRKRDIEAAGPGYYVADVRNFQFSDVAFSAPTTLEVKSGAMAQGVCPARFSYTYDRIGSNGQASPQSFGDGMTFYFFKDSFGGWSVQWSR